MPVDRPSVLARRAAVVRALRAELDGKGFIEVQTPLLVPGTCPDVHIQSFQVPGGGYLVSSTEYQLKRLYAEGVPAAYTLGANFRAGDLGALHNPEFTMLEWGSAGADMQRVEAECEALVTRAASAAASGGAGRPAARWRRVTIREAVALAFGVDVVAWADLQRVPGPLAEHGDAHLSWVIDEALRALDPDVPTWVVGWPASMTASAGLDPADPSVTLRSELMWRGLEIADGFPFACDEAWQRARTADENRARVAAGAAPVVPDERFLSAVGRLPAGAGMALGVDRLCLALFGLDTLSDVMSYAWNDR